METAAIMSAGVGAVSSIAGGASALSSGSAQASQYKMQARLAEAQASEQEAQRRQELDRTLSTQTALRGASGLDPNSATGQALRYGSTEQAMQDVNNDRLNGQAQAAAYRAQAQSASNSALASAFGSFGSGLMSGATTTAKLLNSKKTS